MMIIKSRHVEGFLDHLNRQDEHIKFTLEREADGQLPILDSLLTRTEDGNIDITVYRKPTHTEQYLSYDSCHPLEHKKSVVNTLVHRANNIITSDEKKKAELEHINQALTINGYPKWLIKQQNSNTQDNTQENTHRREPETRNLSSIVIPYVKGLSERVRVIMNKHRTAVAFKPHTTMRNILVHPKDKTEKLEKTGVVYQIQCNNCNSTYVGETERKAKSRISEHRRPSLSESNAMAHHLKYNKHTMDIRSAQILDQEPDWHKRGIREAIQIRLQKPSLHEQR